ncbi:flavohemoglobin expression-modulating QEGLA motif protein [Simiduia curdlanivorans]|uniref:Flavohemoglobin expression-modulating QEGLA motif protein n=1 Tax=Simiduia curdlanivorans TaxID=1492769 RepID=A0ABV8UZA6_9GAMM|nr:flavohemoglobin expression-modulating QEGLA motif protein [Simiduia curdlanivorans]MDN3639192.1 flavohemoglobin expression-modulating QEGLA motif protein [Simiduia curdlanivorans]
MAATPEYLAAVKLLSDRIVEAQKPIRILDAVKWNHQIKQEFFKSKFKSLPKVDAAYYTQHCPLGFDPHTKRKEFHDIERDINRQLGQLSPVTGMMRRACREYQMVVRLLEARGGEEFGDLSQELYGSASDVFHAGDPTVAELGTNMEETLVNLLKHSSMNEDAKTIDAETAVQELNKRMAHVFPNDGIRVMISDGITADAAAGTDYIKIRKGALLNNNDIDVLEAHEGWVHLGTTLNGMAQPYCTFLGKGQPSATVTQEGLAVLTEIITLRSTPSRLYKLINRVRAVTLAEDGANFIDVFNYLRSKELNEDDSYVIASRVFRGSTPTGRPFTKDISYMKGFVQTFNFMRLAVAQGKLEKLPLLFVGKIQLEDLSTIEQLMQEGIVLAPKFVPPHFADLKGLAAWLSFSRFIAALNFQQLESDYASLLS